jgi:hypothetical protein
MDDFRETPPGYRTEDGYSATNAPQQQRSRSTAIAKAGADFRQVLFRQSFLNGPARECEHGIRR